MRKPTRCRSCNYNYSFVGRTSRHQILKADYLCLVCGKQEKIALHEGDELSGEAVECHSCHNYIRYTNGSPEAIWKDEIFLPNDFLLIRNYEKKESFIFKNNKEAYSIPKIIEFTNINHLFIKLKTLIIFS